MRSSGATALLVAVAAMTMTLKTPAANSPTSAGGKDIPATITLDREHTSVIDRLPTGAGGNEFRGDNPDATAVSYTDGMSGKRITAFVGRNRHITLNGNNSSSLSSGRTAFLDLGDALGCPDAGGTSVRVNIDGVAGCDPCINTAPLVAPLRFGTPTGMSGQVDNFELTIIGEDYDDLSVGCDVLVTARLKFVIAGQEWEFWWGHHARAGGATMNPEASPLRVRRVSNSEWRFQTTGDLNGDHRAALYRQENPPANASEYHGQVHVKFSGKAVALSNPGAPPPLPPGCDCQCHVALLPGSTACVP